MLNTRKELYSQKSLNLLYRNYITHSFHLFLHFFYIYLSEKSEIKTRCFHLQKIGTYILL